MNAQHKTPLGQRPRRGFTLTELLVVMMVIGILSSTVLFAMYGAVQQAKEARAQTQVVKVHDLLMTRWDSYRTRPVRLLNLTTQNRKNPRVMAAARLNAIRELMRMEMPDRRSDVLDDPVLLLGTTVKIARPSLSRQYLRAAKNANPPPLDWKTEWTTKNQGSECLYLILSSIRDFESNGLDAFPEAEIGDTDGDNMLEILDPWGNPIWFVRWAPGFIGHPGTNLDFGDADDIPNYSNLQDGDPTVSPDPFDPLRSDKRAPIPWGDGTGTAQYQFNFALYPLVCSSGPDGEFGLVLRDYDPASPDSTVLFSYFRDTTNPNGAIVNDPYSVLPTCKRRLGEPYVDSNTYADNITNHAIETR